MVHELLFESRASKDHELRAYEAERTVATGNAEQPIVSGVRRMR